MYQADRLHHTYIIGQTGTGKSTLLGQLMEQDISYRRGCCLLDPHGDLARSVASVAGDKAIYWDLGDPSCPYGYNPLTYVAEQYRPLVASGLIDTLKKQWADAWGARMEHMLRYALLALLSRPGSSLRDIVPMFLSKEFQKQVLNATTDEQVRFFWFREFPKMNYKSAADGVAPIANKLGAFLAHPVVRKAICAPEKSLRFREIIDTGGTLIVNLAKGSLGSDVTDILGGLIVSSIALAAYSRQVQAEKDRRPYFLYIDEFHAFTTSAFADMLSELRKYKLGLVLSHQFTSQLSKGVLEAVLGNVGTSIVFRLGANDAPLLAKQLGSERIETADFVGLENFEFFIKMVVNGHKTEGFSGKTQSTYSNRDMR
ncbi:helicase HerA domain-containing protein [uncultured Roseibium sp.]|uniref:type IV secretory system conjugative DNA transfer family protein n=1 Tax=uncultured Roseibium sp. TaxID=1936171 RepID=UPI0032172714